MAALLLLHEHIEQSCQIVTKFKIPDYISPEPASGAGHAFDENTGELRRRGLDQNHPPRPWQSFDALHMSEEQLEQARVVVTVSPSAHMPSRHEREASRLGHSKSIYSMLGFSAPDQPPCAS